MHYSVMLKEVIDSLNLKDTGIFVDATLGYAGHTSEILARVKRGFIFAFDQDINAINYSQEKLSKIGSNFLIIKSNFLYMKDELLKRNITEVDGIVFDLGVTSLPSFVIKMKFAPPVSSTFVLVAESKYIFSSYPC